MGKEEEIARIARRLDKMVTKKSAVRGAGRQDPGTPAPPSPHRACRAPVRAGEATRGAERDPRPGRDSRDAGRPRWWQRTLPRASPGLHPRTYGRGRDPAWTLSRQLVSGLRPRLPG